MMARLEGAYHWVSVASMTVAVGLVVAGNTALEPVLQGGTLAVSLAYWTVCSAAAVGAVGFALVALMRAQQDLRMAEARIAARSAHPRHARSTSIPSGSLDF